MVQLNILTGAQAGTEWIVNSFPVTLGRSQHADVAVDEPGVWDLHAQLDYQSSQGYLVRSLSQALTSVNGQTVESVTLRNGDVIEMGAARVQFWLSPTRQKEFKVREILTWVALGLVVVLEVVLIYWLGV